MPVTEVDLDAIARALDEARDHRRFTWAAGYITGSLIAPRAGSEDDSVASILGHEVAPDTDPRTAHIVALHREVARQLAAGSLIHPDLESQLALEPWCAAFMHGISNDDCWFEDDEIVEKVHPIAILAGHEPLEEGYLEPDEDPDVFLENARLQLDATVLDLAKMLAAYRKP